MFTATIRTEPPLVAVAGGGFVTVGSGKGVPVAVRMIWVWVGVSVEVSVKVGKGVGVGKPVEVGKVGKGTNVTVPKLNRAVGVARTPWVGKILGLGTPAGGLRGRRKLTRTEQTQQKTNRNKTGRSILPICPCWSYMVFNADRKELICFVRFSIITCKTG